MVNDTVLIPVDFDDLDDWLMSVGSDFSASELQGALVGALAGAMRLSADEWSAFSLAVMGADNSLQQDASSRKMLAGLAQEQLELLSGDDLSFRAFLPDDDHDIAVRVESLSLWCKGFLGGFAEAQVRQASSTEVDVQSMVDELPENVAEVLRDITEIAQVAIEREEMLFGDESALDDEFDDEFDQALEYGEEPPESVMEYDERDYMELVEYLKLGALTVFTEYGWVEAHEQQRAAERLQSDSASGPVSLADAIQVETIKNRTLH